MSAWIDGSALGKVVGVGLLFGAGLPAVFAIGLNLLNPVPSVAGRPRSPDVGGTGAATTTSPPRVAAAALCFAIVLAAIAWGIYLIVDGA